MGGALAGANSSASPVLTKALAGLGLFGGAAEALLIGLAIALPQWFVLRKRVQHAAFWIPMTALGVAIGIGLALITSVGVMPRLLRGIGLGTTGPLVALLWLYLLVPSALTAGPVVASLQGWVLGRSEW